VNRTVAVPSLSRLSPSIKVLSFLEAPSSFSNATTATGSVADTIDPNTREPVNPELSFSGTMFSRIAAVTKAPTKRMGPASNRICASYFLKRCQSE